MKKTVVIAGVSMAGILAIGITLRSSPFNTVARSLEEDESMVMYHKFLKKFQKYEFVPANSVFKEVKAEHPLRLDPFALPQTGSRTTPGWRGLNSPTKENESPENSLNLTGILWDAKSPYAVIGDEIVSPGSRIGTYTVRKIYREKVVLASRTKRIVLKLPAGL